MVRSLARLSGIEELSAPPYSWMELETVLCIPKGPLPRLAQWMELQVMLHDWLGLLSGLLTWEKQ